MDFSNLPFDQVVKETWKLLSSNREWEERYEKYIAQIQKKNDEIEQIMKSITKIKSPLFLYNNISKLEEAKGFQVRYRGQIVAVIQMERGEPILSTDSEIDKRNQRDFNCSEILRKADWKSSTDFRNYFSTNPIRTNNSGHRKEEHRIESLLLTEFNKGGGKSKLIQEMQPVLIGKHARFQMPTPFKGSKPDNIEYVKENGGGIDILARVGKGKGSRLCVIELKDKNEKNEPPSTVIKQALVYATFVQALLRSSSGEQWRKFFGYPQATPKSITINVVCALPFSTEPEPSFKGTKIPIGNDFLELHYLFFEEKNNTLTRIETSMKQCIIPPRTKQK